MEKIIIEETINTPEIILDGANGYFSFAGQSYPENTVEIYEQVLEYIEKYKQTNPNKTILDFSWLYYNTSTVKIIIKIIRELQKASKDFKVNWKCNKELDVIIEKGTEIKEALDINFEIILIDKKKSNFPFSYTHTHEKNIFFITLSVNHYNCFCTTRISFIKTRFCTNSKISNCF